MHTSVTHKNILKTRGFTLLETLVAISILIVAITATFSAAQSGLASAIEARDQVVAFYLAQEAVELVRNVRDENSLQGLPWLTGLSAIVSDSCYFGKSCVVDGITKSFTACTSPTICPNLSQDTNTSSSQYGQYGYNSSWTPTAYNREIQLTQIGPDEITATVIMTWTRGPFTKVFKVKESIFNWQQ